MPHYKYIFVFIILTLGNCTWNEDTIPTNWLIAEDSRNQVSIEELASLQWTPTSLPKVLGFSEPRVWLKAKLSNISTNSNTSPKVYYLINPVSYVEDIQFYKVVLEKNKGAETSNDLGKLIILDHQKAGSIVPIIRKFYKKFPYPIYRFELEPDKDINQILACT